MAGEVNVEIRETIPRSGGALVLYAPEGGGFSSRARKIWDQTGLDFARLCAASGFSGRPGHILDIVAPEGLEFDRLIVLGRGRNGEFSSLTAWTDRGGSLAAKLDGFGVTSCAVVLDETDLEPEQVAELAAGVKLRRYSFEKYKTRSRKNGAGEDLQLILCVPSRLKAEAALAERMAVAEGTLLARTLVNEPANVLGPVEFAGIANKLSDFGIEVEVLTPSEMASLGMNALLAVAQGSERPARLVVMQWRGGTKGESPVAFIGKGVVFDTGGNSIKAAANMGDMKGDMGGAAAVVGLMRTLAQRKARVNVVGIVGLVENMPDGKAYRPGDILTTMAGTTVEVITTDAEGRLVLADALWYAQERFRPRLMIDLATLTGAVIAALGHDHAGLFSNSDELADALFSAGMASGEKVWRLPLGPAYEKMIESRFADIKNSTGRLAGSVTAAQFLAHFVKDTPWAHLDIAGTAFGAPNGEINGSWASGFGVALLDRYIRDIEAGKQA